MSTIEEYYIWLHNIGSKLLFKDKQTIKCIDNVYYYFYSYESIVSNHKILIW